MLTETVTIIRGTPGGFDAYGDPVAGTETRTDVVTKAPLAFVSSTENEARGRAGGVLTGAKVYLPEGTDIRSTDHVEARGLVYAVDGDVGDWRSDTAVGGIEVALTRAVG